MALSYGFCLGAAGTQYDAQQLAEAFHALTGDGLCAYAGRFALSLDGFTATLAPGFALAAGRWLKSDEPYALELQPSGNYGDRTDAVAVRVDYAARKVAPELLTDVDPAGLRADPSPLRNDSEYSLILYFIRVKRGATVLHPEDVTDVRDDPVLCGAITPLAGASAGALYVYRFLTSGIDQEVARLIGLSNQVIQKADAAMKDIDAALQAVGTAAIGDVLESRVWPVPRAAWLPCDGGAVPEGYPALSAMLGGTLPGITPVDPRFRGYIYGGPPVSKGGDYGA